jgi:hypothetical protein
LPPGLLFPKENGLEGRTLGIMVPVVLLFGITKDDQILTCNEFLQLGVICYECQRFLFSRENPEKILLKQSLIIISWWPGKSHWNWEWSRRSLDY